MRNIPSLVAYIKCSLYWTTFCVLFASPELPHCVPRVCHGDPPPPQGRNVVCKKANALDLCSSLVCDCFVQSFFPGSISGQKEIRKKIRDVLRGFSVLFLVI